MAKNSRSSNPYVSEEAIDGAAVGETVSVWSVLSSERAYNVAITVPGYNGTTSSKVSRVTILPGENVIPKALWTELSNVEYYKALIDNELIGLGEMPKRHIGSTFMVDKRGGVTMAPAPKSQIGKLCPKALDVSLSNHVHSPHIRIMSARDMSNSGFVK